MTNEINITTLEGHVRYHIKFYYAEHCAESFGYCGMPDGYALMKTESCHFYWLRKDGLESLVFYRPIDARDSAIANREGGR